jgi:hypothetical protein
MGQDEMSFPWAHYTKNHKGFVIGWDVNVAGFTNEAKNLIPAQLGNVVYTATRPNHPLLGSPAPMQYGQEYAFRPELFEKLQRLFLYKAICWSYEEEVRVAKCVSGTDLEGILSGPLERIQIDGRPLYLAPFPPEAIKEIYLGISNPIVTGHYESTVLQSRKDTAQIFEYRLTADSWSIVRPEYGC